LLAAKALETITSFAKVSDAEIQEYFRLGREAVQVDYIAVSPEAFIARAKPTDAELKDYYQKHQDEFRVPEKSQGSLCAPPLEDFLKQVEVSPQEMEEYLKEHRVELVRPQVIQVREIFLALPEKATDASRQKVKQQGRGASEAGPPGRGFCPVGPNASQDEASRKRGGDLGAVSRGQKGEAWDKVAFALARGEVGLARTGKGYHLIKVEEIRRPKPCRTRKPRPGPGKAQTAKSRQLARAEAKRLQAETARASFRR
jgi:peptidyl-prolyl cis-trans isomerase D